jgi:ATP-dependent RNA helicase HelY
MAANLIRRYEPDEARHLLNLSFAQYRADRVIVQQEAAIERLVHEIAKARADAECELGDVPEYGILVAEAQEASRQAPSEANLIADAMMRLRPGDVVIVPSHRTRGRVAVLTPARGKGVGGLVLPVVTDDGRRLQLRVKDFPIPPRRVAHLKFPTPFEPQAQRFLRAAGEMVRALDVEEPDDVRDYTPKWMGGKARQRRATPHERLAKLHPVAGCPDASKHLRALARVDRLEKDLANERKQRRKDDASLGRQLDRVLRVLEQLGCVDGWALTERGDRLARLYHECDLLIADCIEEGLLDGLDAADLAGLCSVFTYESRSADIVGLPPGSALNARIAEIEQRHHHINNLERRSHLPLTREIDAGFADGARAWARGEDLAKVLEGGLPGGDFVRNVKQLVDLLRQIALVAPNPLTRAAADEASEALYRGVVAVATGLADQPA